MKKFIIAGAAVAALGFAGSASASSVTVTDPSGGTFSGGYTYTDANGTTQNGQQSGYVQANNNGVVACNGNPKTLNGPEGSGQGQVWIGPGNAPKNPGTIAGQAPGGAAGAGNNTTSASQGPCNDNPSASGVSP